MSITRLSGGLTPADGADPRTFPSIFNSAADFIEDGFRFKETVYFTSNGTFTKATYPWLRAIRVKCQAGGGGGGGCPLTGASETSAGGGGSGGSYSESFITDISGLSSSESITVGAGGTGGVAGNNAGVSGGNTSFGALVLANGGVAGASGVASSNAGRSGGLSATGVSAGDLVIIGNDGQSVILTDVRPIGFPIGGSSFLSGQRSPTASVVGAAGSGGRNFGGGGTGTYNYPNNAAGRTGGNGAPGIVIVELYA
jgi:hypothetical protein